MKTISAKVTYSVDPLTVIEIRELAEAWGVSQSEVIRRAVRAASLQRDALGRRTPTEEEALAALQQEPRLSAPKAKKWAAAVREERRKAGGP
jgi:Arc/MetJ-type ribon-helix-helix transcriptional regulator